MNYLECECSFINYVKSYASSETIKYYDINLRLFRSYVIDVKGSADFDINDLRKEDYVGYISYQRGRDITNTSVRTYARAIKVFLRYCYNEGYMFDNITSNVKFPKADNKLVIPLSEKRVNNMIRGICKSYMSVRNMCIFYLMLDCGLRLGEVVALNRSDVNFCDDYITVINSKNNKSRIVPISSNVKWYLQVYTNSIKYPRDTVPLILDNEYRKRINENSIELVFSKLKKYDSDIHPHLLRHTFATSYILGGGSLEVLRVLMGHSDYNVTKEYLHIASYVKIGNFDIYKLDDVFFRAYNYRK